MGPGRKTASGLSPQRAQRQAFRPLSCPLSELPLLLLALQQLLMAEAPCPCRDRATSRVSWSRFGQGKAGVFLSDAITAALSVTSRGTSSQSVAVMWMELSDCQLFAICNLVSFQPDPLF